MNSRTSGRLALAVAAIGAPPDLTLGLEIHPLSAAHFNAGVDPRDVGRQERRTLPCYKSIFLQCLTSSPPALFFRVRRRQSLYQGNLHGPAIVRRARCKHIYAMFLTQHELSNFLVNTISTEK